MRTSASRRAAAFRLLLAGRRYCKTRVLSPPFHSEAAQVAQPAYNTQQFGGQGGDFRAQTSGLGQGAKAYNPDSYTQGIQANIDAASKAASDAAAASAPTPFSAAVPEDWASQAYLPKTGVDAQQAYLNWLSTNPETNNQNAFENYTRSTYGDPTYKAPPTGSTGTYADGTPVMMPNEWESSIYRPAAWSSNPSSAPSVGQIWGNYLAAGPQDTSNQALFTNWERAAYGDPTYKGPSISDLMKNGVPSVSGTYTPQPVQPRTVTSPAQQQQAQSSYTPAQQQQAQSSYTPYASSPAGPTWQDPAKAKSNMSNGAERTSFVIENYGPNAVYYPSFEGWMNPDIAG